jgi:hypothetical protein
MPAKPTFQELLQAANREGYQAGITAGQARGESVGILEGIKAGQSNAAALLPAVKAVLLRKSTLGAPETETAQPAVQPKSQSPSAEDSEPEPAAQSPASPKVPVPEPHWFPESQTKGKGKVHPRIQAIKDRASEIPVTDDSLGSTLTRKNYQHNLTNEEESELESQLEDAKDTNAEEAARDYFYDNDYDINEDDLAKDNGYSDKDIANHFSRVIKKHLNDHEDADDMRSSVDDWYSETGKHGHEAIDELEEHLQDAGHHDLLPHVGKFRDQATEDLDSAREEAEKQAHHDYIENYKDNYDDSDDRYYALENMWNNLPHDDPRFLGADKKDHTWQRDEDGDHVYHFTSSAGVPYQIMATRSNDHGHPNLTVSFANKSPTGNDYGITGDGGAHDVFSTITPALSALIQHHGPHSIQFTAASGSRQKLYDRLVKTIAALHPEYKAYASGDETTGRSYVVAHRDHEADMLTKRNMAGMPNYETLVKSLPSQIARWFTPQSWRGRFTKSNKLESMGTDIDATSSPELRNRAITRLMLTHVLRGDNFLDLLHSDLTSEREDAEMQIEEVITQLDTESPHVEPNGDEYPDGEQDDHNEATEEFDREKDMLQAAYDDPTPTLDDDEDDDFDFSDMDDDFDFSDMDDDDDDLDSDLFDDDDDDFDDEDDDTYTDEDDQ